MHSLLNPSASPLTVKKEILRYKSAILDALELEKHIRRKRGWIVVETDEWARYDGFWTDTGGGPTATEMESWYSEAKVGREEEMGAVGSAAGMNRGAGGFWD